MLRHLLPAANGKISWRIHCLGLCLVLICGVVRAAEALPPDALKAIDSGNGQWVPALVERNAKLACQVFAENAVFIAPDGTVTSGTAAFTAELQRRFDAGFNVTGGKVTRLGAHLVDGVIVEWGRSILTVKDKDGTEHKGGGDYLAVWSKTKDGVWKIARNIAIGVPR
ncbi:MAG TPA: nuclear transport factor 2 family protein [Steroidobacteraceae bacterium]|jgi:ketosteroid isomerase-like protein